jgi:hypothetical protein
MNEGIQVNINVLSIEEEYSSFAPMDAGRIKNNRDLLKLSQQLVTEVCVSEQVIKVHSGIRYQIQDDEVSSLIICTTYRVQPFEELLQIDKEKKQIRFSADFIPTLISAAYDSLRGIFYEKTKGSVLSELPLPLSSPATLSSINRFKVTD